MKNLYFMFLAVYNNTGYIHPWNVMITQVYIDIVYVVSCTTTDYLNVKKADGLPYENGSPLRVQNCTKNKKSMMLG